MNPRTGLMFAAVLQMFMGSGLAFASGETVNVNIGTLPAGKSVTIVYDVSVNTATPPATTSLTQQGTVSGSNFSNALTDDPDAAGTNDPTVTLLANEVPVAGFGKALSFNGVDHYLLVPDAGALSAAAYTVEAWVKFDTIRDTAIITRNIADDSVPVFGLYLNAAGNFAHVAYDGSVRQVIGTTVATPGTWYHLAGVYESTTNGMRLFVNGVEEGSAVTPGSLGGGMVPDHFAFGKGIDTANYLQGQLDEVRIWNTPRSGSDISSWMYRSSDMSHPLDANLRAYYRLDDGSGTTAAASRGNINGTLKNMTDSNWIDSTVNAWYTDEDVPVTSGKLVGSDADGASTDGSNWVLSFELVTDGTKGHVVIGPDNTFTYTPTADVNGDDSFSYRVKDALSATSNVVTVPVHIAAVNDAPIINAIGDKTVDELATLAFTVGVTHPDPDQTLIFSLDPGAPAGAAIDASTGVFSWTPTEAQGPGSYPVTIRVTDNGTPVLDGFETIQITVNEVNSAPVLAGIGNKTVDALGTVSFTATATDSDLPANTLTYSLDSGAPAGASIDASSGMFSWTPTLAQAPGAYDITVRARDNGSPLRDAAETIRITVNALPPEVSTNSATGLYAFGATINGTVNDNGFGTSVTFDYGDTVSYGSQAAGGTVGAGTGATAVSANLTGLVCGTTYHFRVTATNVGGAVVGADRTFATIPCPPVLYAVSGGATGGSCEDWAHGCELRYALANAVSGEEIWARAGTYKPTASTIDRSASFQLKSGVDLYGGFAGSETARSQRNWTDNPTVLSGDLLGNDGSGFTNRGDNSIHVVIGANSATLDGFTVSGGLSDGLDPADPAMFGAGMLNDNASPAVVNCTFIDNLGNIGAGMGNINGAAPTVTGSSFSGNLSDSGAGMANAFGANPTLTGCTFNGNHASDGGAILNYGSMPTVTNCTFSGNSGSRGGALFNEGSNPVLTNCTFSGNTASVSGGAMFNSTSASPIIRSSIFWGDSGPGGEIYTSSGNTTVTYSVVQGGYPGTGNSSSDPLLAPLGDYGGPTHTMALLPGSPAIDAGEAATCAAGDQRGIARPQLGSCDIGAFESRGFTITKTGGDNQSAVISTPFAAPLALTITAISAGEPVNGGTVTLTPPVTGAGIGVTSPFTLTISGGTVSQSISANDTTGSYGIAVATTGATGASFSLANVVMPDTVIDSRPTDPDIPMATFTFHGTDGVAPLSFKCQLDGVDWSPCVSPQSYTGLSSGSHTFAVKALDNVGNPDATPATYTWTVSPTFGVSAIVLDGTKGYVAQNGGGIWKSSDNGVTWSAATMQPSNPRITGLAIHPVTRSRLFAASYGSGVYFSSDSGETWGVCANSGLADHHVVTLAADAVGNLYVGTEGGIFTSSDCSAWSAVNNGLPVDANKPPRVIVIDASNPAKLYAGFDGFGVFRSSDSGANWSPASTQPTNPNVRALVIKPGDSATLFAATYGNGVFVSSDSGNTWAACPNAGLANLKVVSLTIDTGGKLYAGTEGGVFVSNDGCASWTERNAGLP